MKKMSNQVKQFFSAIIGGSNGSTGNSLEHASVYEKYNSLDSFVFLWKNCLKKMSLRTSADISFSKYFSFGSDMGYIRKFIGNPKLTMDNPELNITISLYTVNIKGHHVNFELHFYDSKLFCINYTYNFLTREERAEILQSLEQTYHVSSSDFDNHIIVDQAGNGLVVDLNEQLSINYLSPNSRVKHLAEYYPIHSRAV